MCDPDPWRPAAGDRWERVKINGPAQRQPPPFWITVRVTSRDGESERLTALGGLAALSLDALSSVAYGPEAILVVCRLRYRLATLIATPAVTDTSGT
jgi:hypothetical protein